MSFARPTSMDIEYNGLKANSVNRHDLAARLAALLTETEESAKVFMREQNLPEHETYSYRYGYLTAGIKGIVQEMER